VISRRWSDSAFTRVQAMNESGEGTTRTSRSTTMVWGTMVWGTGRC